MASVHGSPSPSSLGATQQSQPVDEPLDLNNPKGGSNVGEPSTAVAVTSFLDKRGRTMFPRLTHGSKAGESSRDQGPSPLLSLPNELLLKTLEFLKSNDKESLRQVTGHLQKLVDVDSVTVRVETPTQLAGAAQDSSRAKYLALMGGNFSQDDMECVKDFKNLEQVRLIGCSHDTIVAFGALYPELPESKNWEAAMVLAGEDITDATLEGIPKTVKFVSLAHHCSQVTDEGIKKLKERLPELEFCDHRITVNGKVRLFDSLFLQTISSSIDSMLNYLPEMFPEEVRKQFIQVSPQGKRQPITMESLDASNPDWSVNDKIKARRNLGLPEGQ